MGQSFPLTNSYFSRWLIPPTRYVLVYIIIYIYILYNLYNYIYIYYDMCHAQVSLILDPRGIGRQCSLGIDLSTMFGIPLWMTIQHHRPWLIYEQQVLE